MKTLKSLRFPVFAAAIAASGPAFALDLNALVGAQIVENGGAAPVAEGQVEPALMLSQNALSPTPFFTASPQAEFTRSPGTARSDEKSAAIDARKFERPQTAASEHPMWSATDALVAPTFFRAHQGYDAPQGVTISFDQKN